MEVGLLVGLALLAALVYGLVILSRMKHPHKPIKPKVKHRDIPPPRRKWK